jgi:predicted RNA binding protein YcfA (HicA-like mRNA interferase family)
MSTKMPVVNGQELVRALQRLGFRFARQTGSHVILDHADGRFASVPVHGTRNVPIGTLRGILANANIDVDDLRRHL